MSVTNIIIRRATVDDAEVLSNYSNALADEQLNTVSGLRFTREEQQDFLQKASDKERAFVLIALDNSRIVGVLDLWAGERPYNRHTACFGMSVLAPCRCKGTGRKLLEAAISETKAWPGFCRMELDVVPWNEPAIHLYESMGFVREGIKRKAVKYHGKPDDLILMALVW